MCKDKIMRNHFLKELEQKQEMTVNYWNDPSVRNQSFYVEYLSFPVIASEEKYIRLLESAELKMKFNRLHSALGVTIYMSSLKQELTINFPHKGFYCYRKYYGILRSEVRERLHLYLPEIRLTDGEKPKRLARQQQKRNEINKQILNDLKEGS